MTVYQVLDKWITEVMREIATDPATLDKPALKQFCISQGVSHEAVDACKNKVELLELYANHSEQGKLLDAATRIACRLHAHVLLLFRNVTAEMLDAQSVTQLSSAFLFLSTRHTWNMRLLQVPETTLFELMQVPHKKCFYLLPNRSEVA